LERVKRLRQVVYECLNPQPDWPTTMAVFTPASRPFGSTARSPEPETT
jgi:hypothetical protein